MERRVAIVTGGLRGLGHGPGRRAGLASQTDVRLRSSGDRCGDTKSVDIADRARASMPPLSPRPF